MMYTNIVPLALWTLLRWLIAFGLQHGPWVARPRGMKPQCRHTGPRAGPLKMYILRKQHNTGIKLYYLVDASTGYIMDVHLYT